eukprot:9500649-Pyramimonas_sp.AAC.1
MRRERTGHSGNRAGNRSAKIIAFTGEARVKHDPAAPVSTGENGPRALCEARVATVPSFICRTCGAGGSVVGER